MTSTPLRVRRNRYSEPRNLDREVRRARALHAELSRALKEVIAQLRLGQSVDLSAIRHSTQRMVQSILRHPDAFAWVIKMRDSDPYSFGHSVRATVLGAMVGRHLGLDPDKIEDLSLGVMFCDVGKARLSTKLLEKAEALTDAEREQIQKHVEYSIDILEECGGFNDRVLQTVATHHERFDGSGYFRGLCGDEIPLAGRIAGLVDTYDAMTSQRPFTDRRYTPAEASDYLYDQRDRLFQGNLVEEFIKAIGIYPTGTLVELSTGEIALILEQSLDKRLQPELLLVLDGDKRQLERGRRLDLEMHNRRRRSETITITRAVLPGEYGLDPAQIADYQARQHFRVGNFAF